MTQKKPKGQQNFVSYKINKRADFIFSRAHELHAYIPTKHGLVHALGTLLELAMPELSDENVSIKELRENYKGFELSVQPFRREKRE